MNVLLITLDQFRGDCLSAARHPVVRTPNLDRLAREGVRLARHYSQAAPCSPGRASLYTGMYQLNHRVVANGTPLDARFDNIAHAARRAGYAPTLFGYTDQAVDPRTTDGPDDPRLLTYEEILPGFDVALNMQPKLFGGWMKWLREAGYDVGDDWHTVAASEPDRPADVSLSAFVTDHFIDWLRTQRGPWFAHVSQLRPHPPYAAAGEFSRLHDSADMPPPIAPSPDRHRVHDRLLKQPRLAAPTDPAAMAAIQTQYYGMIAEADYQLGRIWAELEASGAWADTFIVVTADHGEQMGDHGLIEKAGWFEQSYHILGVVRDPGAPEAHGTVVERFTENVDIFPTLCEAMGIAIPAQCDGRSLTPFLQGVEPADWRDAAHWEWDWRASFIPLGPHHWPDDRRLERSSLAVLRGTAAAYIQFGDGDALAFDLAADPTWRTPLSDPAAELVLAKAMLAWRMEHADRTLTGLLVEDGGVGRWPLMPDGWGRTVAPKLEEISNGQ